MWKGTSAGGLGALLHLDAFADAMRASAPGALVLGAPDAGFFLDHRTADDRDVYTPHYRSVVAMQNTSGAHNAECAAALAASGEQWRCFMAPYALPFVRTPLFVTNDLADAWQAQNILQLGCNPTDNQTQPACTSAQLATLSAYRADLLAALAETGLTRSRVNGAWLPACFQHALQNVDASFTRQIVQNASMTDALSNWISVHMRARSSGGAVPADVPPGAYVYMDGEWGTNPTC